MGTTYGRVATQKKPAHLDGSLVLTLRRRLARIRVRKQGHQGQMVGGAKQLHHMEISGLEAWESTAS